MSLSVRQLSSCIQNVSKPVCLHMPDLCVGDRGQKNFFKKMVGLQTTVKGNEELNDMQTKTKPYIPDL